MTQEEFDRLWLMFYAMTGYGFVAYDTWRRIGVVCRDWYVDDCGEVRDAANGDVRVENL